MRLAREEQGGHRASRQASIRAAMHAREVEVQRAREAMFHERQQRAHEIKEGRRQRAVSFQAQQARAQEARRGAYDAARSSKFISPERFQQMQQRQH